VSQETCQHTGPEPYEATGVLRSHTEGVADDDDQDFCGFSAQRFGFPGRLGPVLTGPDRGFRAARHHSYCGPFLALLPPKTRQTTQF